MDVKVVFVAIDGAVDAQRIAARVAAATAKVCGVPGGTMRTSLARPVFSFALDGTQTPRAAVAGFRKAIFDPDARLTIVRSCETACCNRQNRLSTLPEVEGNPD